MYLDIEKKVWKIKTLEIPIIENIPMKSIKWFRDTLKDSIRKQTDGKLTQLEAMEIDDNWWNKICDIGLKTDMDKILDTNVTEKEFRDFMSEVYYFLTNLGTIEEAKLSGIYDPKIQKKEAKQ